RIRREIVDYRHTERSNQSNIKRPLQFPMKFSNMLATAGEWLRGEGPHHRVVISSRVRLARNLQNRPFPGWAKKAERNSILELIRSQVEALPEMQESFSESLQDLSALDRQVLVERHLISSEHAAKG